MKKKYLISMASILAAVLLFCLILWGDDLFHNSLNDSLVVEVEPGSGTLAVASDLREQGVIENEKAFTVFAMIAGYNGDWISGSYEIEPGMGYGAICKKLTTPGRTGVRVVLLEGKQARQMAKTLEESGICSADDFMSAVQCTDYDFPFLEGIDHENPLEGYLYPDTYFFEPDTDAKVVVETMLYAFEKNMYRQEYIDRAEKLGYTFDEMLILASIVESEASGEENRKLVAGVFHNRLNSEDFPKLQSCVTVEYAMGVKKSIISHKDTLIDSPYNTYKYPGLPIGPICNPSVESLESTLWYAESPYFFFQSDKNGDMYFAETGEEHSAIKLDVQANWDSEVIEVY